MTLRSESHKVKGVMLNAYPDSVGQKLRDMIQLLQRPAFKNTFSFFYILPTFFNSDLDRGFSIIDYDLNKELVSMEDLKALEELKIQLKSDIVLNHLSVASPQFKDLIKYGEASKYKDFFINWNSFWEGNGIMNNDGIIIPNQAFIQKLFMRKSGLPILQVPFPDGSKKPYWNTFYQEIIRNEISVEDLNDIEHISLNKKNEVVERLNKAIQDRIDIHKVELEVPSSIAKEIRSIVERKSTYLGQMDVNAASPLVWEFYEETLAKLKGFGCKILRLDAFAYLHKEVGEPNFFNQPGTWNYLNRISEIAEKNNLLLLPEIHAEYGLGIHDQVAQRGFCIYDFFLPGLLIHTLETSSNSTIIKWMNEIVSKGYTTVNMLGCHDGIPVLDLKGKEVEGSYVEGLLKDEEIDAIMDVIIKRGGKLKNLFDADGKKLSYYQVNATFFSALGEDEKKLLLARAIQLFAPGIPQVWYLDLFAGKNDYLAVEKAGSGGHKEINRTNLSLEKIDNLLHQDIVKNQLKLIEFRNTSEAFLGTMKINPSPISEIDIFWEHTTNFARLKANLKTCSFVVEYRNKEGTGSFSY